MHSGEKAAKPKSLFWKSATDCMRFDCRIWICKSTRAQLMIWNSFSARTTASPCSHVVSADERRLRSKRGRNRGEIKGNGASFTVGCSCSTSSFTCRCITSLSELLGSQILVHVKVYFLQLLLFCRDDSRWKLEAITAEKSNLTLSTPVGVWWRSYGLGLNQTRKLHLRWKSVHFSSNIKTLVCVSINFCIRILETWLDNQLELPFCFHFIIYLTSCPFLLNFCNQS